MRRAAVAWAVGMALFTGSAAAAPQWLPTQRLFAEAQALHPSAVMAPDGTIMAEAFGHAAEIRPPGGAFGFDPGPGSLPYDGLDSVALVQGRDGSVAFLIQTRYDAWASVRRPGGGVAASHRLFAGSVYPEGSGVDDAGNVWALHIPPGTNDVIVTEMHPDGTVIDHHVDTVPADSFVSDESLAVTSGGRVTVAYLVESVPDSSSPTCTTVSTVRATDGGAGGFGAPTTLASGSASGTTGTFPDPPCIQTAGTEVDDPHLAIGSEGDTIVSYSTASFTPTRATSAVARYRPAGGGWRAPETIAGPTADVRVDPRVVAAGSTFVSAVAETTLSTLDILVAGRRTDGSWTPPRTFSGPGELSTFALAGSASGAAVVAWIDDSSEGRTRAAVRSPDGSVSDPVELSADLEHPTLGGVGMDDQGNAVVVWGGRRPTDPVTDDRVFAAGYDASGPRFAPLSVPRTGAPGQPLTFSATPVDVWSPPSTTPTWSFGDGATATGTSVSHAFARGTYTVSVSATDALGNVGTERRTVSIAPSPAPQDRTAPKLTHVKVKHRRLSFTLSEPAKVKVTIALKTKGVRKGKRCVKRRRHQHGRSCTRYVTKKTVTKTFTKAGTGLLTLPRLKRGTYRITVVATDATGNKPKPVTRTLRVR